MGLARDASGVGADLRALASQIHPVFMLPPLAASWFGAIIAGTFTLGVGLTHMLAMFFAVYTAHVKDGYIDFYRRGEDDDHPLTSRGCRLALAGATTGFLICLAVLWTTVGTGAVLITAPTWAIGYLHAPQFDTNPVTTTLGYPTGIALAIVGGTYVQAAVVPAATAGFALVFLLTLAGVKIIDDEQDFEYDRSIGKHTVSVSLGRSRARSVAVMLLGIGQIGVLWGAVSGLFPPSSPVAAVPFGFVAAIAVRARPTLATMLLIRGAYVFLACLVASVWFQPLTGLSMPDITVFGSATYLLTELVFGTVALALLVSAGAVWRAARTIFLLYPVAYLWDWYTLSVGVFQINARTGIDLFGIPLEEHLFMIVVPGLVVGLHETVHSFDANES